MATEFFSNTIDFLSSVNVIGTLSAGVFESPDSANWNTTYTIVQTNSASWSAAIAYVQRFDYVSNGIDYSYSGVALDGTLESDPLWKITRLVFSDAGALSSIGVAQNVTWNERLTATYT